MKAVVMQLVLLRSTKQQRWRQEVKTIGRVELGNMMADFTHSYNINHSTTGTILKNKDKITEQVKSAVSKTLKIISNCLCYVQLKLSRKSKPWTKHCKTLKQEVGRWNFRFNDKYTKSYLMVQFSSVAKLCLTLCDLMNGSTPGLPVHHQLPECTQTHVHQVDDAIQPSHLLSSPSPPALNLSQHQGLFQWVSSLHQVAKILEFPWVLPMNTQDWSPLRWTGWISL